MASKEDGDDASYQEESPSTSSSSSDDDGDKKPAAKPSLKKRKKRKLRPEYHHEMVWETPLDKKRSYTGPTADFSILAGRNWGKDSCFKYLPIPEIDSMVGWATHVTHDGTNGSNTATTNKVTIGSNGLLQEEIEPDKAADSNPLLGVQPDGPLPHSHLDAMIHEKARDLLRGTAPGGSVDNKTKEGKLFESILGQCDTSALVAMGMVLEEAITANLLPLAEYHVQRCRYLEQQEEDHIGDQQASNVPLPSNYERESFHQWTLPPEEAIFNVMLSSASPTSEGRGLLPSTCPPTRSSNNSGSAQSTQQGASSKSGAALQQDAAARWCDRQKLEPRFVQRNMDLYQWFVPTQPPLEQAKTKKRAYAFKNKGAPANNSGKKVAPASRKKPASATTPASSSRKRKAPANASRKKPAPGTNKKSTPALAKASGKKPPRKKVGSSKTKPDAAHKKGTNSKEESFLTKLSRDLLPEEE